MESQIEKLINILSESKLSEIEYENEKNKLKIKVKKNIANEFSNITKETTILPEAKSLQNEVKTTKTIVSTGIGKYFYAENIKVGETVKVGQTLGNIQVMGIKTPFKSTVSGKIVELKIEDGGIVDYGKPILEIKVSEN